MKNSLCLFLLFICSSFTFAQIPDPDLFKTWYLYYMEVDKGGPGLAVRDVEPRISPTLTITQDPSGQIEFTGFGACNEFSGDFTYLYLPPNGGYLTPSNYIETGLVCEFQQHIDFEAWYFSLLSNKRELRYDYVTQTQFVLESNPGFLFHFGNEPLLNPEFHKDDIAIYPNPVKDHLILENVSNVQITSANIYDATGRLVLTVEDNYDQIDLSTLTSGLFFIKIDTTEGTFRKKIVKE